MKTIGVLIATLAISCTSLPPQMTMAERKQVGTVTVDMSTDSAVSSLTQFFMASGYSIDGYDENTRVLSTGWGSKDISSLAAVYVGKIEQRVQVAIHDRGASCELEFFIYNRTGREDETLNLYQAPYEDLVSRFRAHLSQ